MKFWNWDPKAIWHNIESVAFFSSKSIHPTVQCTTGCLKIQIVFVFETINGLQYKNPTLYDTMEIYLDLSVRALISDIYILGWVDFESTCLL